MKTKYNIRHRHNQQIVTPLPTNTHIGLYHDCTYVNCNIYLPLAHSINTLLHKILEGAFDK